VITVLRSSAHALPPWRQCGGGRRSAQIEDILRRHGIAWQDELVSPPPSRPQLLAAVWHLRFRAPRIRMRFNRDLVRYLAADYWRYQWHFAHHPETRVFLLEEVTDYARLRAAREAGVGIICLPHNLETWQQPPARDFYSGESLPIALHREAVFAGLSDVVFCISREEQWFLANHGAVTDHLPYFPSGDDLRRLDQIRNQRLANPPTTHELLVVASGHNARNREGLRRLAGLLRDLPTDNGLALHLGGQQLEDLRPHFDLPGCTFHGEMSAATLDALMVRCRAAIVYQPAGVGALTRIPELLCAGLPVLADPHAARSAYHLSGLHLFHNARELLTLAQAPLAVPPRPSPDLAAEQRLVAWIRTLAESGPKRRATP
jgi:hypothetical protein